jgi:hypothetical protein
VSNDAVNFQTLELNSAGNQEAGLGPVAMKRRKLKELLIDLDVK